MQVKTDVQIVTQDMVDALPEPVRRYMMYSRVVGSQGDRFHE